MKSAKRRVRLEYKPPKPRSMPLPRESDLSHAALVVGSLLNRIEEARIHVTAWQAQSTALQHSLAKELSRQPVLRRSYEAFIGSGGLTGAEFTQWVSMHGARQQGVAGSFLKLVVNNQGRRKPMRSKQSRA